MIDLDADLREGDLVWLETPLNPTGEVRSASDICPSRYDLISFLEILLTMQRRHTQ
jgi:hypothetical protein